MAWLEKASIYVQASRHEAFGLSMAEAMLCGCIPVVSTYGAIPEVAGDQGVYFKSLDEAALSNAIQEAIQSSQNRNRSRIRARIEENFPLNKRFLLLASLLENLSHE